MLAKCAGGITQYLGSGHGLLNPPTAADNFVEPSLRGWGVTLLNSRNSYIKIFIKLVSEELWGFLFKWLSSIAFS